MQYIHIMLISIILIVLLTSMNIKRLLRNTVKYMNIKSSKRKVIYIPRYKKNCVLLENIFYRKGRNSSIQYWSLLNWQNLRLRCVCVAVPVNRFFALFRHFFSKFKNVVHSLVPGETPSNSASHQTPSYVQRFLISQNTSKCCVAVALRLRLFFQFT